MSVGNQAVEQALRSCLQADGYSLTELRGKGEMGVDILATKDDDSIFVEVIGFKDSPSARSRDFFEVFFRAISRFTHGATHIAIALPERFSLGLHQRATWYGPAWERLATAFPELELWLVNHELPSFRRTAWLEWLKPDEPEHDPVREILNQLRSEGNRSWVNLRRGRLDLLGKAVEHSNAGTLRSARTFARKAAKATGMTYRELLDWLDDGRQAANPGSFSTL